MPTNHHDPIALGATNHPDTLNTPLSQLDAAIDSVIAAAENELAADLANFQASVNANIADLSTTLTNSTEALQDEIDALIAEAGTSDAETIAARNRIRYLAGTPPAVLGDTVELVGRNQIYVEAYYGGTVLAGDTADRKAIQDALNAAVAGDVIVFKAGKTYDVPTTLTIPTANVTLLGYGATIDASDLDNSTVDSDSPADVNPSIKAQSLDNLTILGLRLIGPDIDGSLNVNAPEERQTAGIFLYTCNHCMVRDCRIEGFFRGGIYVLGNYNSIIGNHLDRVRYRPPEMGSIFLHANENSTVVGNVVTGVWGCGIGAINSYRCTIQGNVVEGIDWTVETEVQSMGICTYNSSYMSIAGNTIERVTDEAIIMTSGSGTATKANYNTITGNVIFNPKLYGICLRIIGGASGNLHYANHNVVSNNAVVANAQRPGGVADVKGLYIESSATGAGFNFAEGNVFSGNMVVSDGHPIEQGFVMTGAGISRTSVIGNVVKGCDRGIEVLGLHCLIANNGVYESVEMGIVLQASSNYCLVQGNKVSGTPGGTPAIKLVGALTGTKVVNNFIDTPVDVSTATGSLWWHGDNRREDIVSSGTGTLVGGTALITGLTTALCQGAIRLTRLTPASTPSNTGALYISNIDLVTLNRATVTSTNASDNGTFFWELVR